MQKSKVYSMKDVKTYNGLAFKLSGGLIITKRQGNKMSNPVDDFERTEKMLKGEPKKLEPIIPPFIDSSKRKYDKGYDEIFGKREQRSMPVSLKRLLVAFSDEGKDDFAMTIDDLFFRMEQMDVDSWWFQLYKGEQPLFIEGNLVETRKKALSILINKGMEILNREGN